MLHFYRDKLPTIMRKEAISKRRNAMGQVGNGNISILKFMQDFVSAMGTDWWHCTYGKYVFFTIILDDDKENQDDWRVIKTDSAKLNSEGKDKRKSGEEELN